MRLNSGDEDRRRSIRDGDAIGALNFLRRSGHKFYLVRRYDFNQAPGDEGSWLFPDRDSAERARDAAIVEDVAEVLRVRAFSRHRELLERARLELSTHKSLAKDTHEELGDFLWNRKQVLWDMKSFTLKSGSIDPVEF